MEALGISAMGYARWESMPAAAGTVLRLGAAGAASRLAQENLSALLRIRTAI